MSRESRMYKVYGNKKDLDTLEKFLRHAEYLVNIGASRNLMLRVDGDGSGQIVVEKVNCDDIKNLKVRRCNYMFKNRQRAL